MIGRRRQHDMEEQQSNTQEAMPLFSGLLAYAASRPLQFHIGAQTGCGMAELESFRSNALSRFGQCSAHRDLHQPRG